MQSPAGTIGIGDDTTTVHFLRSCARMMDDRIWDIVDYHFTVTRDGSSCDIAVGIAGDWQDRLSPVELRRVAEVWLMHRLHHGYDPFGEPASVLRVTQVPFGVVDYWMVHRALPH